MRRTALYAPAVSAGATMTTIAGWTVAESMGNAPAGTTLVDTSHNSRLIIEGEKAAALLDSTEVAIGGSKPLNNGTVYRLRHDQFLLLAEPGQASDVQASLNSTTAEHGLITITDVTNGRAELTLCGPDAAQTLSRLCGLDFHNDAFPNGTAKQSSVAKTRQIVVRQDRDGTRSYQLIGSRSLAIYLWETVLEAGAKLDVGPGGLKALP